MSTVPDKDLQHLISAMRHQRSCANYGPRMLNNSLPAYRPPMYGVNHFHRTTSMSANCSGSGIVKSSRPSWVAAQGKECMCLVTWVAVGEPNLKYIFDNPFEQPEAKVSLQLGKKEVKEGSGLGASFVERNKIVVISFLRELLKKKSKFTSAETLMLAVYLFNQLFRGSVEAENIEIFVWEKDEQHLMRYPAEYVKALLKVSIKLYDKVRCDLKNGKQHIRRYPAKNVKALLKMSIKLS